MSVQAELGRCRVIVPAAVPPTEPEGLPGGAGLGSEPQIVLSPRTPTSRTTFGFMFFFVGDASSISIWKRDPASLIWALLATITPPDLAVLKWITVCTLNASELYFEAPSQVPADNRIFVEEIGPSP